ncbi:MAG: response regulator, partial [Elainellaceae cyanobacterium]
MKSFAPEVPSNLILIVDDQPANLKVLRGLFANMGYRLTFATSGEQALERAQAAHPDLILLDLMLPDMSGLAVCRQLKKVAKTADIPVIFLTASHELDHLVEAFEEGAADYVTKPFRSSELLTRVQNHLLLQNTQA